jgi:hypothetical protein
LAEKPTDDVSIPKGLLLLGSVLAAGAFVFLLFYLW